ncbi:kinase domain-containing protein [Favolaschia claudopus]|uniref:Kinase domain-containing protein n=1 Tax=Favolaschia claudopus TaxID=2862362 RepID=A0AAV9Z4M1_9AGAR
MQPDGTSDAAQLFRPWYAGETKWVELQPFLLSVGLKLRPRYSPDWSPSWMRPPGQMQEDFFGSFKMDALDAIRVHDNEKVVLKWVETESDERKILEFLWSIEDSRNHTIPVLNVIPLPPDQKFSVLVMPYTRRFNHPAFHCRGEFVEAMQQLLEGLQFMHEYNVAHFDIAPQNLMMEEHRVVPGGSHFLLQESHTGFPGVFSWNHRCSVGPVKYYYIDFGLSMYFPEGKDKALTTGTLRTFKTIPELSLTVPYNPFKVDIFQLGLTMHNLIEVYPALKCFRPIADRMTSADPKDRPELGESLNELNTIANQIPKRNLKAPIFEKAGTLASVARLMIGLIRKDHPASQKYEKLGT